MKRLVSIALIVLALGINAFAQFPNTTRVAFPLNRASASALGRTGLTLGAQWTPSADGSFEVAAFVDVTTATTHTFTVTVSYNDEGNVARTVTLNFVKSGDATAALTPTIVNTNGAIDYVGVPIQIRVKAGTLINVTASGTFTTVTFDLFSRITQVG